MKTIVRYKCRDCGHEQDVTHITYDNYSYAGSGANWCDKCGDGKPDPIIP